MEINYYLDESVKFNKPEKLLNTNLIFEGADSNPIGWVRFVLEL
jgi:hypothetical protein